MKRLGIILGCLLLLSPPACQSPRSPAGSRPWSGWRGPNGDGSALSESLAGRDNVRLELEWARPLGSGYSSISVVDALAVTMFSDGTRDHVVALDAATGEERWRYEIGPTHRNLHAEASDGPMSTPAIAAGSVYALGPKGDLIALTTAGELRWRFRIDETLGAPAPPYGFATSPAVVDGALVVAIGAGEGRAVCGLDTVSGEERWCTGSDPIAYQSPVVTGSPPRVIVPTDRHFEAVEAAGGDRIWLMKHIAEVRDGYAEAVPVDDELLVMYYLSHAAAYRITSAPLGIQVREVWRTQELGRNLSPPVVFDDRLIGFRVDSLVSVDLLSGERQWTEEGDAGRGLLRVDDLLVIWEKGGRLRLARPERDGVLDVAVLETGLAGSHTSPSLADGRIFVRNHEQVAAVRIVAD